MAFGDVLSARTWLVLRIMFDFLCIAAASIAVLLVKYGGVMKTYQRGFFCDDESIQHPYLPDTVPMYEVISVGLLVTSFAIFITEWLLRNGGNVIIQPKDPWNRRFSTWYGTAYIAIAAFLFGVSTSQFTAEMAKRTIGRLRPHFLTVCAPDYSRFSCAEGYITDDVCTSTEEDKLKNARMSFPSGHSSLGMYCTVYLILYIHCRVSFKKIFFIKPLILLVFFCLAFYTCLSRISDYKHHWSDVLSGALIGTTFSVAVVLALTDFGKMLRGQYSAASRAGSELPRVSTGAAARHINNRRDSQEPWVMGRMSKATSMSEVTV